MSTHGAGWNNSAISASNCVLHLTWWKFRNRMPSTTTNRNWRTPNGEREGQTPAAGDLSPSVQSRFHFPTSGGNSGVFARIGGERRVLFAAVSRGSGEHARV